MSEITQENYLQELFIDEVKGCLTEPAGGVNVYELGASFGGGGPNITIHIDTLVSQGVIPDTIDVSKLTSDNFIIAYNGVGGSQLLSINTTTTGTLKLTMQAQTAPRVSYNASSKVLSISNASIMFAATMGTALNRTVYIYPKFKVYLVV